MKQILAIVSIAVSVLNAGTITVAAAANVSYAMEDLKKAFNRVHPDIKVKVTLGSSGKLTAQIKNGAPYQLFMAANMKYPEALYKEGIAITKPLVYARGSLAYLSRKKIDFSQGILVVVDPKIKRVAVANPKTAPYGKAAVEALKKGGVYENAKRKFVYGESISQTVAYAITAADIGLIAKSSLFSPKMARFKKGIHWADVDPKLYTPINQGIVMLKKGMTESDVAAFYTFILSSQAKKIFKNYGYLVP